MTNRERKISIEGLPFSVVPALSGKTATLKLDPKLKFENTVHVGLTSWSLAPSKSCGELQLSGLLKALSYLPFNLGRNSLLPAALERGGISGLVYLKSYSKLNMGRENDG